MDARECFDLMIRKHVEQPLNVQYQLLSLLPQLPGDNSKAIATLSKPEVWRDFMPPLYNYLMTNLEVFLENYFLETYRCANGRQYITKDEWFDELDSFKQRHAWPTKEDRTRIRPGLSFQNLPIVDLLYFVTFGFRLSAYPQWQLIRLMFSKRHLFTHRAGFIDRRYVEAHNFYHLTDAENRISKHAVGKKAFLEREWLWDSIKEVRAFVKFIVEHIN